MSIKQDQRHLYLQVIEKIKQDIEGGVYAEKQKLPSEFELAKELGVSRATLREALRVLEEENVIVRKHGVGTFVNSKPKFSSGIEQLSSVTDMIKKAGMKTGTIFLEASSRFATVEESKMFNSSEEDTLLVLERLRTADGLPVVYCIDTVLDKYLPHDFSHMEESIFQALERQSSVRITYAVSYIEPLGYHERISPLLECEPDAALLVLKQMHYDEADRPILYSVNYFKSNVFSFHVMRRRV
ncbi:MAG: GntR family transcriptional regulator [Bacillus sp. (in: firmicutes)]